MRIVNCTRDLVVNFTQVQKARDLVQKQVEGCAKPVAGLRCNGDNAICKEQCPYLQKVETPKRRLP